MGLLDQNMPPRDNIQLESLIFSVDDKARKKAQMLSKLGGLLTDYKEHKVSFKEETFTLFDLANYIYDELVDKNENELMFLLVGKFKAAINRKLGRPPEAEVDPRKPYDVAELDQVFDTLCSKNQREIRVMSGFLEE